MALVQVEANLGNEGVGERELCQGVEGDGKLPNADKANSEL